ncbi:MAG: hypothetical protein AB8E15_04475 [Bdellovibrionales bacterium]
MERIVIDEINTKSKPNLWETGLFSVIGSSKIDFNKLGIQADFTLEISST